MVERKVRSALHVDNTVKTNSPKLFVLDTNVLMHDPTSLFRFEEHDIFLPMITLEELDNNKKGTTEVARNARQASRFLDELVTAASAISAGNISAGIPLKPRSGGAASGRLFVQTEAILTSLPPSSCTCRRCTPTAASSWCRRTSTCASSRMRWGSPPRTTSTTRCSRTPTSSTAECASCRRTSGTA